MKKEKKPVQKKKSLGNIFIPDFFGGETSHRNKNKQTSKKKKKKKKEKRKKTGKTKKDGGVGSCYGCYFNRSF